MRTIFFLISSFVIMSVMAQDLTKSNIKITDIPTTEKSDINVIPTPQKTIIGQKAIKVDKFFISSPEYASEAAMLRNFLVSKGLKKDNKGLKIIFRKGKINGTENDEAYKIEVGKDVIITAPQPKGAFYAVQTIKQLISYRNQNHVLPQIEIIDWPSFKIRGFMQDTGRNFQSMGMLKEQLEVLAQYKMNVFHWHLTDNPGWRLESKKYPQLQSDTVTTRDKGKFYSQRDFKDILDFCRKHHITVIPEFDIPGHTAAFRKAFNLKKMGDEKVLPILTDLFDELLGLADAKLMPLIHIGNDEVKEEEQVSNGVILAVMDLIKSKGRDVVVWKEGIPINQDSTSIYQLWANYDNDHNHRFIDSRSNYINHLDPLAGMSRLYFQQPCRQVTGDSLALGGILCSWPDNNVKHERDILKQNPIYPSIVFYAEAMWKGKKKNHTQYWAKLPPIGSDEFLSFKTFENKVIKHRDLYFDEKPFPYIHQTGIQWKLIGPFDHGGDFFKSFPVERSIRKMYLVEDKEYSWSGPHVGGTIHLKHFFGFPAFTMENTGTFYAYTRVFSPDNRVQDFWIGFHNWSRAGGRRGGPSADLGQWHNTSPTIWVNDRQIAPPNWKQPKLGANTEDIPFVDEDYYYRKPTKIELKKGWNKILIKIPHGGTSWKWMFTCIPVRIEGENVREVLDLKFDSTLDHIKHQRD